jgi:hypothetical protein
VHGRISDAATSEPIAGALVRVYAEYGDAEPAASVTTATDGAYAWTGDLPPERIAVLRASTLGHLSEDGYFDSSSEDVPRTCGSALATTTLSSSSPTATSPQPRMRMAVTNSTSMHATTSFLPLHP